VRRGLQFFSLGFQGEIVPGFELVNALLVDVKADDGALLAEFDCKRKAHVA
jgi:hypothetical protein